MTLSVGLAFVSNYESWSSVVILEDLTSFSLKSDFRISGSTFTYCQRDCGHVLLSLGAVFSALLTWKKKSLFP